MAFQSSGSKHIQWGVMTDSLLGQQGSAIQMAESPTVVVLTGRKVEKKPPCGLCDANLRPPDAEGRLSPLVR